MVIIEESNYNVRELSTTTSGMFLIFLPKKHNWWGFIHNEQR